MGYGDNIRRMRIEAHLTLKELGDRCGVTPQAVYRWETERNEPNMKTIMVMCDIFHCTADELAGCYTQPLSRTERDVIVAYRNASDEVKRIIESILEVKK